MHLSIVIIFVGLFAEPQLMQLGLAREPDLAMLAMVLVPKAALAALYGLWCHMTRRRLVGPAAGRRLARLERLGLLYRTAIVALCLHDVAIGALQALRVHLGDWILLNELLLLSLPIAMLMWSWWCYYPIDRRLRDAQLLRRLDEGLPVHAVWTRGQFVVAQLRFQVVLAFMPLLLLLALSQIVYGYAPERVGSLPVDPRPVLQLGGAGCIFLFAPVMIRHLWDVVPLPPGPLRERLVEMCALYHVGVRELLIWRTFGGMVNAAVMGLVRPLRYILLSDGLLELVPPHQVESVMAHELGHVNRHHMFWLLVCAASLMTALAAGADLLFGRAENMALRDWPGAAAALGLAEGGSATRGAVVVAVTMFGWATAFGWVSRRFERQADTFAVQHLARADAPSDPTRANRIGPAAATTMVQALEHVAVLNHMNPRRRSWRHGSIRWRQQYLHALVGQEIGRQPIDRHVRWIKLANGAILLTMGAGAAVAWAL